MTWTLQESLTRKSKGDLAELKVACDLIRRGYGIAIPYGEDSDFDLIVCREGILERVQVKHASIDETGSLVVKCRSHSLTNGKVRTVKHYTSKTIDWIAIWDRTTDRCFYVPATELGAGKVDAAPEAVSGAKRPTGAHPKRGGLLRPASSSCGSGASGIRTRDLPDANRTLSQLSYGPAGLILGGPAE